LAGIGDAAGEIRVARALPQRAAISIFFRLNGENGRADALV